MPERRPQPAGVRELQRRQALLRVGVNTAQLKKLFTAVASSGDADVARFW
jgi:hypothetical protein